MLYINRVVPDIQPAGYPAFFISGMQDTGYPAGYPVAVYKRKIRRNKRKIRRKQTKIEKKFNFCITK